MAKKTFKNSKKGRRKATIESGRYEKTRKSLKALDGLRVEVGYFLGQKGGDKSSQFLLADIASLQEFGSKPSKKINIVPPRPFLGSTFDSFKKVYAQMFIDKGYQALIGNLTPDRAMLQVAERYRSDVVRKIVSIRSPKNADRTIKAKGEDNPLIETGTMKANIRIRLLRNGIRA